MSLYSTNNGSTFIKSLREEVNVDNSVVSYNPSTNELTYSPTGELVIKHLNVESVEFTGTGPIVISSGNELRFEADIAIKFNGEELQAVAFTGSYNDLTDTPDVITKADLKALVAASTDFADFQARIANL